MKRKFSFNRSLVLPTLFWLLPLAAMPLAFCRLTGEKLPLFGMVKLFDFTTLGLIALAVIVLRAKSFYNSLQSNKLLRFTALTSILILLASMFQQYLYGGTYEHLGIALFYAAMPLAAAAIAPELRKALPFAASIGAVLLLWSGLTSENFTGLAGNWNWTQGLLFALLPAILLFFNQKRFFCNTLIIFLLLIGAGAIFYSEILSRSVLIALGLLSCGIFVWLKLPCTPRKLLIPVLFLFIMAIPLVLGIFCQMYDSRIHLYQATVGLLKDHGIIGVGMERFFDFIPEYITQKYFMSSFPAPHHPHPHNEVFNLWSAFGISGILYIGTLFSGMLYKFPRRRFTPKKLLPFWIFFFIFLCAQTDLTGAILPGAYWMLCCAGMVFAPQKTYGEEKFPVWNKIIAAILLLTALHTAVESFRATALLRQGRLAAMKNDAANALKFYQASGKIKPAKEAFYGKAEIYLHAANNHQAALDELEKMHTILGFDNYLHTNRMKAVALVNLGQMDAALPFIEKDAKFYPLSVLNARLHLILLQMLRRPASEITSVRNKFLLLCYWRDITPEQAARFPMSEDDTPIKLTEDKLLFRGLQPSPPELPKQAVQQVQLP